MKREARWTLNQNPSRITPDVRIKKAAEGVGSFSGLWFALL